MSKIDDALLTLNDVERRAARCAGPGCRDVRAKILVTVAYLVVVLSFDLNNVGAILLYALYPIIGASMADIDYWRLLKPSLYVLPLIVCIGLFNPIIDTRPALYIGTTVIDEGWLQFASIIIRGLLCVQATVLLIITTGFAGVCRGLRRLGMPAMFVTQLFLVYRYIFVLLHEASTMDKARRSRGYGRRHYTLRLWSTFVGQLLLRTTARAERIHGAMVSRGFAGDIASFMPYAGRWTIADTIYTLVWCAAFAAGRIIDIPSLFHF